MKSDENERTKLHTIEIQYYYCTTIKKKKKKEEKDFHAGYKSGGRPPSKVKSGETIDIFF